MFADSDRRTRCSRYWRGDDAEGNIGDGEVGSSRNVQPGFCCHDWPKSWGFSVKAKYQPLSKGVGDPKYGEDCQARVNNDIKPMRLPSCGDLPHSKYTEPVDCLKTSGFEQIGRASCRERV